MRVRGAQREMSSAERGTAGAGEEEKRKEGGGKKCWFVEVDPIRCAFPSFPRFASSPLSQPLMETPGGFPTSPAPTPLLPWVNPRFPHGPCGLAAAPGSSGWPWDVPAPVPLPQERPGPCVTVSAPANLAAPREGSTGVCGFCQMGPRAESRQERREVEGTGVGQCLFQ